MKNQYKKIIWLFFIGLFFLLGYFHQHVLSFIYQHAIQAYVITNFGCKLNYESAYLDGNRLIIQAPHLANDNDFKAAQMVLLWHLNLKNREIDIAVELDKPSWRVDSNHSFNEEKLKKVFRGKKGGIKYFFDIAIRDGAVDWKLPDQTEHQLHFDAKTNSHSGGFIKAYFDDAPTTQHYISITTESTPDALAIAWDCHDIRCANLFTFIKLFFPSLSEVKIHSGLLKGRIQTIFPHSQRPYIEGEMIIEQAVFSQDPSFSGKFEKARLSLRKNPDASQLLTTIAQIDFLAPVALTSYNRESSDWQIDELVGSMHLDGNKKASIQLTSTTHFQRHESHYKLDGSINLDARRDFNVNLHLCCASKEKPEGTIRLLIHEVDQTTKKAEIELINLSSADGSFLQTLLSPLAPSMKNIEFQKGIFNGLLDASLDKKGIQHLQIIRLYAEQVAFTNHAIQANGSFSQMQGHGIIHLGEVNPWDSLDLDFNLRNGTLQLEGLQPLADIQAHIEVQKGALHHSLITLQWMGLKGVMDLEWGQAKQLLSLKLDGHVEDVADFFPESIAEGLNEEFSNTKLQILANFKRQHKQFELSGTAHVQRNQSEQFDLIHFGCEFQQLPKENGHQWMPVGWFYAYDLPLEKFVSPFIFRNGALRMGGKGEFRGSFDHQNFTLQYNVQEIKVENDNLLITANDLHSEFPGQMMGFHQVDLQTGTHHGSLPIKNANYYEKHSGLNFTNICGTFLFEDQTLTINPIETYCQGVFLAGKIFMDYRNPTPDIFSVKFDIPQVSGKLSQVQSILSHFDHSSLFNKIPMEGDINSRENGMQLAFDFSPQSYNLHADVQATLIDGSLPLEEADMALKGLYLDVDYHHDEHLLEISDIQGTLLVGKPSRVEEYILGGDHIRLHDLLLQDLDLDIWIKDQTKELIRLSGKTKEIASGLKEIILNSSSHLSCLYPNSFSCKLRNWSEVDDFTFNSHFTLDDLVEDLIRFKNTGLYCFSHSLLNKLADLGSLKGQIELSAFYDLDADHFRYVIEGKELGKNSTEGHHCLLKTHKIEKKWIIDHLQWDDITAHAELLPSQDSLKIPFLGLKDDCSILLGMEGELFPEEGSIVSKINLCELSLADLHRWDFLKPFINSWQPEGKMRGTGKMKIEFIPQAPWYKLEAALQVELPTLTCRHCSFERTDGELTGSLMFEKGPEVNQFSLKLNEGNYSFNRRNYECKAIELNQNDQLLNFSILTCEEKCPYQIKGEINWPSLDNGEAILTDLTSKNAIARTPLRIKFSHDSLQGLLVHSMQGYFCGMNIDLINGMRNPTLPDMMSLQGNVEVDFNQMMPLLSSYMAGHIKDLELGFSYQLQGIYHYHWNSSGDFLDRFYFQGELSSHEAILKGIQLQHLRAGVHYEPGKLDIASLQIQDPAGKVEAERILIQQNDQTKTWWFSGPLITVKNLRPALLRETFDSDQSPSTRFKTLFIKRLDLQSFSGNIDDAGSWQGKGSLHFLNPSRKNFNHPLFAIPAEIILRLGLNPQVLNPVTGTVLFDMQGDRFYFTRFKDVYSEGRGSKFYLAEGPTPSWMDMKGNLSVQIKMKQYNLLFKLAELFTVSVEGNIKRPKFSLQKFEKTRKI
ncbi:MAG: hypothetical protein ACHQUC_03010 [Chlamydiales bacterium]